MFITKSATAANKKAAAHFIMTMFHVRTEAHVHHLTTSSFAEHKALNEFYNEIADLTDGLAESLQGKYGILKYPVLTYSPESDAKKMLANLHAYIKKERKSVCEESDIQNQIDEIVTLLSQTYYKLECLK